MIMYHHWLELPIATRIKIAGVFSIKKTGATHVVDNHIQSDGYDVKEIESKLTIGSLQTYLSSVSEDLPFLWEQMVRKVEGRDLAQEKVELKEAVNNIGYQGHAEAVPEKPKIAEANAQKVEIPKKRRRPAKVK